MKRKYEPVSITFVRLEKSDIMTDSVIDDPITMPEDEFE